MEENRTSKEILSKVELIPFHVFVGFNHHSYLRQLSQVLIDAVLHKSGDLSFCERIWRRLKE